MSWWWIVVTAVLALLAAALGLLVGRQQSAERIGRLREELASARAQGLDERMVQVLRSVSGQAMAEQSRHLLDLAATRYQTLEQASELNWRAQGEAVVSRLEEYAARLTQLESQRQRDSAVLHDAVVGLRAAQDELRDETRGLAGALTDRAVRGTWGEVQLRRVLEQAGMVAHADFAEQRSHRDPDGTRRPDVVVRLPNDRVVVVDAKAPLDAFLRATACQDATARREELERHAAALAGHVTALSRRDYERVVPGSVDFVVLFVPGDAFLSAAFDVRPDLFDLAARHDVILASPGTLLAFLRGVAAGWRERQVAEEAAAVAALGRELHERVARFAEHFGAVGSALSRAVGSYNQALGSLERRLLVTARKFEQHGAGSHKELEVTEQLVDLPLLMSAPELTVGAGDRDEVA